MPKVEDSNLEAPQRVFVAIQICEGNLDYRFIGPSPEEAKRYCQSGWEVYSYILSGCINKNQVVDGYEIDA